MKAAEVVERVRDEGLGLVDLVFSDITGGAKALTIPATLVERTLERGYRFDGSALTGGMRSVELDLYLMPDPSTFAVLVPGEGDDRRGRLCCSVLRKDGQPFDGDPRSTLQRVIDRAAAAGIDYRVGIEMEYYLLRGDWTHLAVERDSAGYFDFGEDAVSRTRDSIVSSLASIGVGLGGAHHETGPGQEEIDLRPTGALRMADQLITIRQTIRTAARQFGLRATFMPKPFTDAPGSGVHVFQQFREIDGATDILRDEFDELSTAAMHIIGGQVAHAAAMCAVLCPTVNSYKRLNAGHRAPRYANWAHVSQTSMIRVPSALAGGAASIELRCQDALANPYLALAVALTAALDGIEHQLDPPEPLEESFSSYNDAGLERIGVQRLPGTLGEALDAFSQDQVVQEALGSYISDQLLTVKRAEWEEYRTVVGPWEHRRYGDA
ncbi:MAG: glutamine synthetase [Thermomicrobiales bacterium]|nr:glutamine synthetase [Thermomicrobiales bacterium]MCO5220899.1 glutamine synthetase family protein [Thermomicrobiales bacterium]